MEREGWREGVEAMERGGEGVEAMERGGEREGEGCYFISFNIPFQMTVTKHLFKFKPFFNNRQV